MTAMCEDCGNAPQADERGLCFYCGLKDNLAGAALHPEVARHARRCENCGHGCVITDDAGRCIACSPTAAPRPASGRGRRCENCDDLLAPGAAEVTECATCGSANGLKPGEWPVPRPGDPAIWLPHPPAIPRCENCGAPGYVDPELALCSRCGTDPVITRSRAGRRLLELEAATFPIPPPPPPPAPQWTDRPARRRPTVCEGCGRPGRLNEDGVCSDCASTAIYRTLDAGARAIGWLGRRLQ